MPNDKKHAKVALLVSITFVLLTVILVAIVIVQRPGLEQQKNQQAQIEQQKLEDLKAAEQGYIKMISGYIANLDADQGIFIIDTDLAEENQKYEISTNKNTVYGKKIVTYPENSEQQSELKDEEMSPEFPDIENANANYSDIEEGKFVEVYFPKRIKDLKSSTNLVAEKVVIYEYRN